MREKHGGNPASPRDSRQRDRYEPYRTEWVEVVLNPNEWWFGFAYASPIRMPDGSLLAVDRNDGAYPLPHWAKTFVILVDDGDADWGSDKEGRVVWH